MNDNSTTSNIKLILESTTFKSTKRTGTNIQIFRKKFNTVRFFFNPGLYRSCQNYSTSGEWLRTVRNRDKVVLFVLCFFSSEVQTNAIFLLALSFILCKNDSKNSDYVFLFF